MTAKND